MPAEVCVKIINKNGKVESCQKIRFFYNIPEYIRALLNHASSIIEPYDQDAKFLFWQLAKTKISVFEPTNIIENIEKIFLSVIYTCQICVDINTLIEKLQKFESTLRLI